MPSAWYTKDILYLVRALKTDLRTGLTTREAMVRLHQSDNRDVAFHRQPPFGQLIWEQARNLRTLLLVGIVALAGLWSLVTGAPTYRFGFVVLVLAVLDLGLRTVQRVLIGFHLRFIESGALRKARVLRNGETIEIDPELLVVGDILRLRAGDYVAADARVFQSNRLCVNEGPLTGISDPIEKVDTILEGPLVPHEQTNMVFAGTFVLSGSGSAVVVATGSEREICLSHTRQYLELPLSETQNHLIHSLPWVGWIAATIAVIVGAAWLYSAGTDANGVFESIALAATVFVALFPATADFAATIVFVQCIRQLEGLGTIVQKPEALETLSTTTTLCFDPQGVITQEKVSLHRVLVDSRLYDAEEILDFFAEPADEFDDEAMAEGAVADESLLFERTPFDKEPIDEEISSATNEEGENPAGGLDLEGAPPDLYLLFLSAALCAEHAEPGEEGRDAIEPLTKRAILDVAEAIGVDWRSFESYLVKVADFPYDTTRRRQTVLFQAGEEQGSVFVIGSAESILERCRMIRIRGDEDVLQARQRSRLLEVDEMMRGDAAEVVAVAYRKIHGDLREATSNAAVCEEDLVFLGLMSFRDEVREGLGEVLDRCHRAGIRLILMSDYEAPVVYRLARDAGLLEHRSQILSDEQLRLMDDGELMSMLGRVSVYARLPGEQKTRIIQLLQRKGSRVAFVGRQLYDITALRSADVAIVPNRHSVDASAHEADLLVEDVSLDTLYDVFKFAKDAGRMVRGFAHWMLSIHFGLAFAVLAGLLLGASNYMSRVPWTLNELLWAQIAVFGIPLTFAARSLRLVESYQWRLANRNVRTRIAWLRVAQYGILLGAMALAAGAYLYHGLPESSAMERATRWGTLLTFIAISLIFLLRTLKGPMTSPLTFLGRNGTLLLGVAVSVFASIALGVSTWGGLFDMPPSIGVAAVTWRAEWNIVLVFAAAALFLSPPE